MRRMAAFSSSAPHAKVFPTADIVAVLAHDTALGKGDPLPVGTKLGICLSMSNWQNWVTFFKEVSLAGRIGQVVRVQLLGEEVNGKKNGYTWGVIGFQMAQPNATAITAA